MPNLALLNKSKEKQPIEKIIDTYIQDVKTSLSKQKDIVGVPNEYPILPSPPEQSEPNSLESPPYAPNSLESPPYAPNSLESPPYAPNSQEPLKIQIPQNSEPIEKESILEVESKSEEDLKTEASNSNNNNTNESKKIILTNDVK